jgi:hypothetical protein
MARLAAREALSREAGSTYLDSLILSTDSVVRRWPDRWGAPIRVAMVEGGVPDWTPRMGGYVRASLERWESLGIGVRFQEVADTGKAEILVRWIDHFDFDRAGQTDLTWDQSGRVRRALVSLALRTNTGVVLPDVDAGGDSPQTRHAIGCRACRRVAIATGRRSPTATAAPPRCSASHLPARCATSPTTTGSPERRCESRWRRARSLPA